jgi:hypothetical protein
MSTHDECDFGCFRYLFASYNIEYNLKNRTVYLSEQIHTSIAT